MLSSLNVILQANRAAPKNLKCENDIFNSKLKGDKIGSKEVEVGGQGKQ